MKQFFLCLVVCGVLVFNSVAVSEASTNTERIQQLLAQIEVLKAELAKLQVTQSSKCTFTRLLVQGVSGPDVTCLQNFLKSRGYFSDTPTGYFGPKTEFAVAKWQRSEGIVAEAWEYGHFGEQSRVVYTRVVAAVPQATPPVTNPTPTPAPVIPGSRDTITPTPPGTPFASVVTDTEITLTWASSTDNVGIYRYQVYKNGKKLDTSKVAQYTVRDLVPYTNYRFSVQAYDKERNMSAKSGEVVISTISRGITSGSGTGTSTQTVTPPRTPSLVPHDPAQRATVVSLSGNGTTYYIDAIGGDDTHTGTSPSNAWKTLAKVSATSFPPGSNILFKKGQTFYGPLIVQRGGTAGNPITFGSYGSGAKPIISGFLPVSNWKNIGNNVWESEDPVSNLATVTVVKIDDESVPMGRYPNEGFLPYESFNGRTAITSRALSGGVNWTGAEIVAKRQRWILERNRILSQSGNTLTHAPSYYEGKEGWGFFIQNDPRTLDKKNEWYYNPVTKKLLVYGRTAPTGVKVSSVDNLITILNTPYIVIDGLALEGANKAGIYIANAQNVTVKNSAIGFSYDGVLGSGSVYSPNLIIEKTSINHMQNNGITLLEKITDALIRDNTIEDTGLLPGMGGWPTGTYVGINARGAGTRIDHNRIIRSGYDAITFAGTNSVVSNNYIDTFCIVKDDGAGIYINTNHEPTQTGIKILGNVILNAIGNNDGVGRGGPSEAEGIYLDESVQNVEVANNTVGNISHTGIYLHNNRGNNIVNNNTVFDANIGFWVKNDGKNGNLSVLRNLTATNNIFVSKNRTQIPMHFATAFDDIRSFGVVDNNYYVRPDDAQFAVGQLLEGRTTFYSHSEWQTAFGFDKNSTVHTPPTTSHQFNSTVGSNLSPNSGFETGKGSMAVWSPTANTTLEWDSSSKITGAGSLKVTPAISTSDFALITGTVQAVTPVSSSKNYLLRFKTLGTTENGFLRVLLRKLQTPYTVLTPRYTASFGTQGKIHEFFFSAPTSESAATFVIELQENSGTTFIDDIELYEADIVAETAYETRFEYNASDVPKTVSLSGTYTDVVGNTYSGTVTLAPWSSKVFIKDTNAVTRMSQTAPYTGASSKVNVEDLIRQLQYLQSELKKFRTE